MFGKGEFVVYGNTGVCEIADITTLDMAGVSGSRLYYILVPRYQKESKIFTPVDSNKAVMRAILTREEANELINDIPDIEELWVSDDKQREEKYKKTIRSGECRDWIKVIKTLYVRKQERIAQGKKTTVMDEKYLRIAEDNLYSELSVSLAMSRDEMYEYIAGRIFKADETEEIDE
ncbi:CarD family transcriptional regulator [Kineothrix sp. MB12-C1]|uniref:CarD family transcriptional regulator n=1 Tax=Kineothrix sp. MB12-C1 TaxID=3070215 RepID=UPI0027D3051A|nr:CarD family transcriptional regulator [Kineothrix sp. MB12-C1]WMC91334.1 CarD family transcriptional regulator [Kineothrix sp. MB12-C1]